MHKKRKASRFHASSRKPTKKCAMKMKETNKQIRKNDARVKMLLMEGSLYKVYIKNWGNDLNKLRVNNSTILDALKVLIV